MPLNIVFFGPFLKFSFISLKEPMQEVQTRLHVHVGEGSLETSQPIQPMIIETVGRPVSSQVEVSSAAVGRAAQSNANEGMSFVLRNMKMFSRTHTFVSRLGESQCYMSSTDNFITRHTMC